MYDGIEKLGWVYYCQCKMYKKQDKDAIYAGETDRKLGSQKKAHRR